MLKTTLIHPEILETLGSIGHGSRVLIADGNYPFLTGACPGARRIFLNLTPGIVSVIEVVRVLLDAIPIEGAAAMSPAEGPEPAIFDEFRILLPPGVQLELLSRSEFYAAARNQDTALVIATGEQRTYANLILTIGVVAPG